MEAEQEFSLTAERCLEHIDYVMDNLPQGGLKTDLGHAQVMLRHYVKRGSDQLLDNYRRSQEFRQKRIEELRAENEALRRRVEQLQNETIYGRDTGSPP